MAAFCGNCGTSLVYGPRYGKMYCSRCGSTFNAEDVEAYDKDILENREAVPMQEIMGCEDASFYDCNVYTCSTCGGEIMINDTEASTYCIYCGNPTVVFSRVSRQKKPDRILPFKISREQAASCVINKLKGRKFIPKSIISNIRPEHVRGIYIPYYIADVDVKNAVFIKNQVKHGKSSSKYYHQRVGECTYKNLPFDATLKLSDESTVKLEPYDLTAAVPFDEDYLRGFYSDTADVTPGDVIRAATKRTSKLFFEEVKASIGVGYDYELLEESPMVRIKSKPVYALLPVWFITFMYKGSPNTILINGQTGKVVCTLPWDKDVFIKKIIGTGLIIGLMFTLSTFVLVNACCSEGYYNGGMNILFIYLTIGTVASFIFGNNKIKKIIEKKKLTQSEGTMNFVRRRQG